MRTVVFLSLVACATAPSSPAASDAGTDATTPRDGGGDVDAGVRAACPGEKTTCSAWNTRHRCEMDGGTKTWVDEACEGGCFLGECEKAACTDECALGDKSAKGTCQLWDMAKSAAAAAAPDGKLVDRARDYDRILRARALADGQVMNPHYQDDALTTLDFYSGTRDAAIWTGSALAAQAFRLRATESPDAAAQVRSMVDTLHRDFAITGAPGALARFVLPTSLGIPTEWTRGGADYCVKEDAHCNVMYDGKPHLWEGGISRDQYTGVMLGYALAYDATHDEAVRRIIRGDVLAVAEELAKKRSLTVNVVVNNLPPVPRNVTFENVILIPEEFVGGRVTVTVDSGNVGENTIRGMREFVPDFSMIVREVLGASPAVPRSSTAIMLNAFFAMALHMAKGAEPTRYAALKTYVDASAPGWLSVAEKWDYSPNCGSGYFANHIAYIMGYVGATVEEDPARKARSLAVLEGRLYAGLRDHGNAYFTYLWSGAKGTTGPEVLAANRDLAEFPVGPRLHPPRDLTADPRYPHDPSCTESGAPMADTRAASKVVVAVRERAIEDFMWQRHPWKLKDPGVARQVMPGVDYLAAYWAARAHGLLADDRPGTCARFVP
ncbi:MAG: hypothetical protein HOO96_17630 [Polyangiaceae bacterium]|nr:hypothetical protein [Polyangiaceae bacterium]